MARSWRHLHRHMSYWASTRSLSTRPSSSIRNHTFGIALDIDGVIFRGSKPLEGASRALCRLYVDAVNATEIRFPFIFLTNGGGVPESVKASEMSRLLGVRILPQQVLLGHTPYKSLVNCFQDARILAVGKGEPVRVLREYGFRKVVSMDDYVLAFRNIDPLAKYKPWERLTESFNGHGLSTICMKSNTDPAQIEAIFIVSDPVDWGREIQVLCDVLRSGGLPGRHSGHQPPLYFAADDFEYQTEFPVERFGMGAFRIALESIYNRLGGPSLTFTTFGKPKTVVYKNAEMALEGIATAMALRSDHSRDQTDSDVQSQKSAIPQKLDIIYMIGDNPATDIAGARKAGKPWFSILTRTGCFKDKLNHSLYPADLVVDNIEEAIDYILNRHAALNL